VKIREILWLKNFMACCFDHSVLEFCICFVLRYLDFEFFLPKKHESNNEGTNPDKPKQNTLCMASEKTRPPKHFCLSSAQSVLPALRTMRALAFA